MRFKKNKGEKFPNILLDRERWIKQGTFGGSEDFNFTKNFKIDNVQLLNGCSLFGE